MYRVFMVDDEPLILAGLQSKIDWREHGFVVCGMAGNSADAIRLISELRPHLVLLDIRMSQLNGLEMIRQVLAEYHCLFIVVSGFSDFSYAQTALQLGALDYLVKPISSQVLSQAAAKAKAALDASYGKNAMEINDAVSFIANNRILLSGDDILKKLGLTRTYVAFYCLCLRRGDCPVLELEKREAFDVLPVSVEDENVTLLAATCREATDGLKLADELAPDAVCAITQPLTDISLLPERVRDASILLCQRFFEPQKRRFTQCAEDYAPLAAFQTSFEAARRKSDWSALKQLLDGLPKLFIDNHLSIVCFEKQYNSMLFSLESALPTATVRYKSGAELVETFGNVYDAIAHIKSLIDGLGTAEPQASYANKKQLAYQIKKYIDEHFFEDFSLQALADKYYIDMSYLSTLFRNEHGENFVSYVNRVRLTHACDMLSATMLSAEQISRLCGYSNYSYFNKVFKRAFGITPIEYRKK